MTEAENVELVMRWFEALVTADVEMGLGLLHDQFRYFMPGTFPASGWWDRDGFLAQAQMLGALFAGPVTMRIGEVTAQDDRVWFESESEAQLVDGSRYENSYLMTVRIRDGRIFEYKEYSDSVHVYETLDAPLIRGERKPRTTSLDRVTRTFNGASVGTVDLG